MASAAPTGPVDTRNHCRSIRRLARRGLVTLIRRQRQRGCPVRITAAGRKAWYVACCQPPKMVWPPRDGSLVESGGKPYGIPQPF